MEYLIFILQQTALLACIGYALKLLVKQPTLVVWDILLIVPLFIYAGLVSTVSTAVVYMAWLPLWIPFGYFYLYKTKGYTPLRSFVFVFFLHSVVLLIPNLLGYLVLQLAVISTLWQNLMFTCIFGSFFLVSAWLFSKLTPFIHKILDENKPLEKIFLCMLVLFSVTREAIPLIIQHLMFGEYLPSSAIIVVVSFPFILLIVVGIAIFSLVTQQKRIAQLQKEDLQNLQFYTHALEQQQQVLRDFKHDYMNILTSIDGHLVEEDYDGLKDYFYSKIGRASHTVIDISFALQSLSKIKVTEIKSILSAKLLIAQNRGVDVTFEADEDICHIPVDSITLVRMLGIILDNATEAVEALGYGKLWAGCFKQGDSIIFIVQNTCMPNMPPLYLLKTVGFSTKGGDRGRGLNNLRELANTQPNISMDTTIENGYFTQRITIKAL